MFRTTSQTIIVKELVYGVAWGQLIFIPRNRAEELAATYTAINNSETWGDFQDRVPAYIYRQAVERLEWGLGVIQPPNYREFDPEEINGFSDGEWPSWPAQEMTLWFPREVWQGEGFLKATVYGGVTLQLHAHSKKKLVRKLQQMGYTCREDARLLNSATGAL
jgi:hypothetical protein